jgi:hypothetical protein
MTTNSVGQSNLTQATTFSSVAPYRHIAIRPAEEERLTQYLTDYQSINPSIHHSINTLAVGQDCHLLRAVTGCETARFNEFWSNIYDSVYTAKYRPIIHDERPVVFVSFSPQFKTKPEYKDGESRFEQMLIEEGYTPIERKKYKYIIYEP